MNYFLKKKVEKVILFKLEKTYGSDLSSRSWQVIKNIILVKRKIKWDLLEIINTIFDPLKTAVSNVTFREGSRPGKSFTGITEMVKDGTWDMGQHHQVTDCKQPNDAR